MICVLVQAREKVPMDSLTRYLADGEKSTDAPGLITAVNFDLNMLRFDKLKQRNTDEDCKHPCYNNVSSTGSLMAERNKLQKP